MAGIRALILLFGIAALTGCGGGGGGGSASASAAAAPPPASVSFNDSADAVSFTGNAATSSTTSINGSQVTVTADANGNARFITLNVPLRGNISYVHTFDLASGVATNPAGPMPGYVVVRDGAKFTNGSSPNNLTLDDTLNFASFGFWLNVQSVDNAGRGTGAMGGVAFGTLTPVSGFPAGSATYTGRTIGGAINGTATQSLLAGTVSLTANFTQMTMGGTFMVNDVTSGTAVPWGNFTLAPTNIVASAGGAYGGINSLSGTISGGPITSSSLNGHFYGPAAQETAGTWSVSSATTNAVGAFGAARP